MTSRANIRAVTGASAGGYGRHFLPLTARRVRGRGAGGPSWFTKYNVSAGLVALVRALPVLRHPHRRRAGHPRVAALIHCGYRTFTNHPVFSGFSLRVPR